MKVQITVCFFIFMSVAGISQPRYGIIAEPTCWTTPGGRDSSITRLVMVSTPGGKKTLGYIDQYAQSVTVAEDSSSFVACFCEELPGYVYPPPGGLRVLFLSYPVINPLDPRCEFGISFDVEFPWEVGDVTATFDGDAGNIASIQKVGDTLVITTTDQLLNSNCDAEDYPHTWVVTVSNSFGSDTKTVTQPAL